MSNSRLAEFKKYSSSNNVFKHINTYVTERWPLNIKNVLPEVRSYFRIRNFIRETDGLLLYDDKLFVSPELKELISRTSHEGHMGITKTKLKLFYWPKMNKNIENLVSSCNICMFNVKT